MGTDVKRFKLGVISDEVSQDLETALKFLKEFDLEWVELRYLWGKYVTDIDRDSVKKTQNLLKSINSGYRRWIQHF